MKATQLSIKSEWVSSKKALTVSATEWLKRDRHFGDRVFLRIVTIAAVGLLCLLAAIGAFLLNGALPALSKFGWAFVVTESWDPVKEIYGALPVIYGTVVSSVLAMLIATPLSIGIALFLNELAPRRRGADRRFPHRDARRDSQRSFTACGAFLFLAPWLRTTVEPFLANNFGFLPLFQGPPYGVGMLAAGVILAIMVIPTVSSISREVFRAIPRGQREGGARHSARPAGR